MKIFYPGAITLFFSLLLISDSFAQCGDPGNYCLDGGTYSICSGTLFDNGAGGPYTGDQTQITICSDQPGLVASILFEAFSLQTNFNPDNSDYLFIYDGSDFLAPLIGQYTGTELQGSSISGSVNNATGCLTLILQDNGPDNGTSPGFQGLISCTNPCAYPTSFISSVDPAIAVQGESLNACVGQAITFSADGSTAQNGFALSEFQWNFGDGTADQTNGPEIEHTYAEPGLYYASVGAVDNNGCASLENVPIQILVSTLPVFTDIANIETSYCLGTEVTLNSGNVIFPTWTSAPPTVVSGILPLPDGAGFAFESSILFDFFDDGQLLTDCNDLESLQTTIEHSYIGDLSISLECPNGTVANILPWPNGYGAGFFGEPVDDDTQATQIGVPYSYTWVEDPTAPTLAGNTGFLTPLPEGTYQTDGNLCDLVGCPLNGVWTIVIQDNLGSDNGWLTEWTVNFNPAFYPEPITFTPTYGGGADSSFWSGPNIAIADQGLDVIQLELVEPGSYTYNYTTSNNFGCIQDTSITIVIEEPPVLFAGNDLDYACEPISLNATFDGLAQPSCSSDAGDYTLCYNNDQFIQETYCPDEPGDGVTMMQITLLNGTIENPFDDLIIYDGNSATGNILWQSTTDVIPNVTVTATNPTGCITLVIDADFTISCGSGNETPINYSVGCSDGSNYVWNWTPANGLSNPNSPSPTLTTLDQTTTFTVTAFPAANPECAVSDDITVSVDLSLEVDGENLVFACINEDAVITAPAVLQGNAPIQYEWTLPNGSISTDENIVATATSGPQTYCVEVTDACNLTTTFCVDLFAYPTIPATFSIDDAVGCPPHFVSMQSDYTAYQNVANMSWDFGNGQSATLMGSSNFAYTSAGNYFPILTITDVNGCVTSDTLNTPIIVIANPVSNFDIDPGVVILPQSEIRIRDYSINAAQWEYTFDEYGVGFTPDTSFVFPGERGEYFIRLVTTNEIGCTDTLVKNFLIQEDIDIFIPNSFTPDGDGINDVWKVEGSGFVGQNFELIIFNRWGQPVFQTTDPEQVWLGDHQGGGYYNQDSLYFYLLKVQDVENDVRYEYQGHILMLR